MFNLSINNENTSRSLSENFSAIDASGKIAKGKGSIDNNKDSEIGFSGGEGVVFGVAIGGSVTSLKEEVKGYIYAIASFIQSVVTNATNNTFATDSQSRDQKEFINQEKK